MVGIGRTSGIVCALAHYSDKSLNATLFNAAMPLLADCPWISEDLPSFHGHYYSSLPPEYSACSSKERPYEWCLMPQMPLMRVAQWVWGGFCIMREECASAHKSLWTSAVKVTNELWQSNTASPGPSHSLMGYLVPMQWCRRIIPLHPKSESNTSHWVESTLPFSQAPRPAVPSP